ncbi:MAG TPA: alpha-amylase/4-alpha-glucanotransferase domain-containing protein [Candidatus Acidoferrales bacterium]|nr:alpha-amylase/4-alpha-glucanotransferase domain-containing protein [Candidatus Acidoferrales bacterium]
MSKFRLLLLIHAHQPIGNFESVFENCYQKSYLPFVQTLERHPGIRIGLHISGPLLEWMDAHHPDYFALLRQLVDKGQLEMIGSGFYEPILISIPPEDRLEQIRRMSDYLEKQFGRRPQGAWLTERVWEPQLPATLSAAGVEYTLVDDVHFLGAGFELADLFGYYLVEDLNQVVKVIPGLKRLRYLVPFGRVEESIEFLRRSAQAHPDGMAAMGDDCEKFGVWPETYDHCYVHGWLDQWFTAIEKSSDWLETGLPGDLMAAYQPLGRADLPASSYTELTEWALPTPARKRFHALLQEFSNRPDVLTFLRGSFWRTFLTKYSEANLMHKKMLNVSAKFRRLTSSVRRGLPLRRAVDQAATHLLRAQCNDAYWHGVFGGLYAPHLRAALWRELVIAEKIADAADNGTPSYAEVFTLDFDADGREEVYHISESYAALTKPWDGGTMVALDFRVSDVTLINSIQRRPEAYHDRLRQMATQQPQSGTVGSIHDATRVKEEGLERFLRYDRWARHCFRLLLFPSWKKWEDYAEIRLEESPAFAGGEYAVTAGTPDRLEMLIQAPVMARPAVKVPEGRVLHASKTFLFSRTGKGFEIACHLALSNHTGEPLRLSAGLEMVFNLLAPSEPDRYFEWNGTRQPLRWAGTVPAGELRMVDEWQNVAMTLTAANAREYWVAPIETVTESEEGFERVYQGSQVLPVWPLDLPPGGLWTGRFTLRVGLARPLAPGGKK